MNKSEGINIAVRLRIWGAVLFVFGFFFVVRAGLAGQEEVKTSKGQSFLRMELLERAAGRLQLSSRNIFSPRRSSSTLSGTPVNHPGASLMAGSRGDKTGASTLAADSSLNLRYIGYVFSGKNRVAVIVYQGETLSVSEGEGVDDRFRVTSVTRTEVRLNGPDEQTFVFPLEGERI